MSLVKHIILISLLLLLATSMLAHSGKARYHVIIDTDGGMDDLRAITLFLASKEVEVLAIHCSDGVLAPFQTAEKVRSLLSVYHHEGIPVGMGKEILTDIPPIRHKISKLSWGISDSTQIFTEDDGFISNVILEEEEEVCIICMGSLCSAARVFQAEKNIADKIEMILWFNDREMQSGLNYQFSPKAYESVARSGIPVVIVNEINTHTPDLDDAFWKKAGSTPSRYARHLAEIHLSDYSKNKLSVGRKTMWDDLLAIYMLEPGLFSATPSPEYAYVKYMSLCSTDSILDYYLQFLEEKEPDYKVFSAIPEDSMYYAQDIAPAIQAVIENHGKVEWRAGVLTNELHGHLGIYAIIGMKMGIRAREYFNIGLDDLQIISLAGTEPPVSCMNDGLQVSTGSTLGHGLIYATHLERPLPAAEFSFKNAKIRITLKDEYIKMIRDEIHFAIEHYTLGSEDYWKYIRALAIQYWVKLDRNEIFKITQSE